MKRGAKPMVVMAPARPGSARVPSPRSIMLPPHPRSAPAPFLQERGTKLKGLTILLHIQHMTMTSPQNNLLPPPWQVNLDFVIGPLFLEDLCTEAIELLSRLGRLHVHIGGGVPAVPHMGLCCMPLGPALLELAACLRCWSATNAMRPRPALCTCT